MGWEKRVLNAAANPRLLFSKETPVSLERAEKIRRLRDGRANGHELPLGPALSKGIEVKGDQKTPQKRITKHNRAGGTALIP